MVIIVLESGGCTLLTWSTRLKRRTVFGGSYGMKLLWTLATTLVQAGTKNTQKYEWT